MELQGEEVYYCMNCKYIDLKFAFNFISPIAEKEIQKEGQECPKCESHAVMKLATLKEALK